MYTAYSTDAIIPNQMITDITKQIISICGCHGYHEAYLPWILQQNVLPFSEILTKLM